MKRPRLRVEIEIAFRARFPGPILRHAERPSGVSRRPRRDRDRAPAGRRRRALPASDRRTGTRSPSPPRASPACSRATVSTSPPVRRTIGTLPYLSPYNCVRPHGSKREGTSIMSAPAMMRCARRSSICAKHAQAVRELLGHALDQELDSVAAVAEDDALQRPAVEQPRQRLGGEVQPFLLGEAADDADQRHLALRQAALPLQARPCRRPSRAGPRGRSAPSGTGRRRDSTPHRQCR